MRVERSGVGSWSESRVRASLTIVESNSVNTSHIMATNISKKRKFVADGVFYSEINEVSE